MLGTLPLSTEWYFFCDDDTYVSVKNLNTLIKNLNNINSLGELITHDKTPENPIFSKYDRDFQYYSGGAGFLIHKNNLHKLAKFESFNSGYGDVSIGLNMKKHNISMIHSSRFHSQHFNFPEYKNVLDKNDITFHYIRDVEDCIFLQNLIG